MNALILAAGLGSRLVTAEGAPKPLVEVAGRSLIEWSVWQAARVGVRRAVIVTGHRAAEIEAHLPGIAARTGVMLEACRLADWSRPNGHSVLAGAARIDGNFLLMMADHLFEVSLLARLVQHMGRSHGVLLAIDRNCTGPAIDPADATWVSTRHDGTIAAIGKHLLAHDAVDCGAFIATPDLAAAIRAAIAGEAAGSLSDGMQRLAAAGAADTFDVTGHWWIDVDDAAMLALARRLGPVFLDPALPAPVRTTLRRAAA
jgi:1L-myo-inositol 1-phosphate cytidylyltransferase